MVKIVWEIEKTLPPACPVFYRVKKFNNGWGHTAKKNHFFSPKGLTYRKIFPIV